MAGSCSTSLIYNSVSNDSRVMVPKFFLISELDETS
jgi:hypothetical protein